MNLSKHRTRKPATRPTKAHGNPARFGGLAAASASAEPTPGDMGPPPMSYRGFFYSAGEGNQGVKCQS
jgi:hypothetical protein